MLDPDPGSMNPDPQHWFLPHIFENFGYLHISQTPSSTNLGILGPDKLILMARGIVGTIPTKQKKQLA